MKLSRRDTAMFYMTCLAQGIDLRHLDEEDEENEVAKKSKQDPEYYFRKKGLKPFQFDEGTYWAVNEDNARKKKVKEHNEVQVRSAKDRLMNGLESHKAQSAYKECNNKGKFLRVKLKEKLNGLPKELRKDIIALFGWEKLKKEATKKV